VKRHRRVGARVGYGTWPLGGQCSLPSVRANACSNFYYQFPTSWICRASLLLSGWNRGSSGDRGAGYRPIKVGERAQLFNFCYSLRRVPVLILCKYSSFSSSLKVIESKKESPNHVSFSIKKNMSINSFPSSIEPIS